MASERPSKCGSVRKYLRTLDNIQTEKLRTSERLLISREVDSLIPANVIVKFISKMFHPGVACDHLGDDGVRKTSPDKALMVCL